MITRRNALKLAAATMVATPASTSTITRAQAAHRLDAPTVAPLEEPANVIANPAAFARQTIAWTWTDDLWNETPEQLAAWYQAVHVLTERYPEMQAFDHPFQRLYEESFNLWNLAYAEGLRAGAAAEQFRQVLIGPRTLCRACDGVGLVETTACGQCSGTGLVPVTVVQGRGR